MADRGVTRSLGALALLVLVAAACSSGETLVSVDGPTPGDLAPLTSTVDDLVDKQPAVPVFEDPGSATWVLLAGGGGPATEPLPEAPIWLRFDGVHIEGHTGCNSFTAAFEPDEGVRDIDVPGAACEGLQGEVEEAFIESMELVHTVAPNDETMFLAGEQMTMIWHRTDAPSQAALTETSWLVLAGRSASGAIEPVGGNDIVVTIAADVIGATTGCNGVSADASIEGSTITVTRASQTDMACGEGPEQIDAFGDLESRLAALFLDVDQILVVRDELLLIGERSALRLRALGSPLMETLDGTFWNLAEADTAEGPLELIDGAGMLSFSTATVSMSGGCASTNTTFSIEGSTFSLGREASIVGVGCPSDREQLDEAIRAAFARVDTISVAGTTLTLTGSNVELVFTQELPLELTDQLWLFAHWADRSGPTHSSKGRPAVVTFGSDGLLTGNTPCRSIETPYLVDGDALILDPFEAAGECTEPMSEQSDRIDRVLAGDPTFEIERDALTITAADQSTIVFTAVDRDPSARLLALLSLLDELAGTEWTLVSGDGPSGAITSPGLVPITIRPGPERIEGDGCQPYAIELNMRGIFHHNPYSQFLNGAVFTESEPCTDADSQAAQGLYVEYLAAVWDMAVIDGALVLGGAADVELVFEPG